MKTPLPPRRHSTRRGPAPRLDRLGRDRSRILSRLEALEGRTLLTSTLFLDYGDMFPSGVLDGITVGDIVSHTAPGGVNINGPHFSDADNNNFANGTSVQLTSFNTLYGSNAATFRARINAMVQRMLAPFDIDVVELTAASTLVEGNPVRAAASLDDISRTMAANNAVAKHNDSYMYIVEALIGGTTDDATTNPTRFADNGYGGLANGLDIGGNNDNENSAFTLLRDTDYSTTFLASQIVHEAGHLLGFRHVYRQDTGEDPPASLGARGADLDLYHESELMSYFSYNGYDFYSRLPVMRGDGNDDPDVLNTTPTPYDHLAADPEVGAAAVSYVTGSGAHDIITITKTGPATATVLVEPFSDAAYTSPIVLPGGEATSFSYMIDLALPLLIDGGARNDRFVLDGDLGTSITVQAGSGIDSLVVDAKGAAVTYTPGTNDENGLDGNPDLRGTVVVGSTTISFQEFDPTSSVTITNASQTVLDGSNAADLFTLTNPADADLRVEGTTDGVAIVPLQFTGIGSFRVNGLDGDDELAIDAGETDLISVPITYDGGAGSDLLRMEGSPATAVDEVIYRPGPGNDQGLLTYENAANTSLMSIAFAGLEPIFALIPATTLTVFGTDASNAITYSQSLFSPNWGRVAVDNFESISFINKANLVINALGGADSISLGNPTTPAGLTAISVIGGLPTDGDRLNYVSRASGSVALSLAAGSITESTAPSVTYTGIESIALTGTGSLPHLSVVGTAGQDDFVLSGPITGSGTVTAVLTVPTVSFDGFLGGLAFNGGAGGFDSATIVGNDAPNAITADSGLVTIDGRTISLAAIDRLSILAGGGDDTLTGGLFADETALWVDAGEGNDQVTIGLATILPTILGGAGNDTITAGSSPAWIDGGTGNDSLTGGAGNDTIVGGDGNDTLRGGAGTNLLLGGNGDDTFNWLPNDGESLAEGGGGLDTVSIASALSPMFTSNVYEVFRDGLRVAITRNDARLITGSGVEDVDFPGQGDIGNTYHIRDLTGTDARRVDIYLFNTTSSGNTTIFAYGTPQADNIALTAVTGISSVLVSGLPALIQIHKVGPTPQPRLYVLGEEGNDTITALPAVNEAPNPHVDLIIEGGDGDDFLSAGGTLSGGSGKDTLIGGPGNDFLSGGPDDDSLLGGDGDDSIFGGSGDDLLSGGTGTNSISDLVGHDVWLVSEFASDAINMVQIVETLPGTFVTSGDLPSTNILSGIDEIRIQTLGGNDQIRANSLSVYTTVDTGPGNDFVDLSFAPRAPGAPLASALILGGDGDDSLRGTLAGDRIEGGDGDDSIAGGTGDDALFGGDGSDTFLWAAGDGHDLVEGGAGQDAQSLSGLLDSPNNFTLAPLDSNPIRALASWNDFAAATGSANMADVESVTLVGGSAGDLFTVRSLVGTNVVNVEIDHGVAGVQDITRVFGSDGADNATISKPGTNQARVNGLSAVVRLLNVEALDVLNVLLGAGDDRLSAATQPDDPLATSTIGMQLEGGQGNDFIEVTGSDTGVAIDPPATLIGGQGNDTLIGADADDIILGGAGRDFLAGGLGNDFMLGDGTGSGVGSSPALATPFAIAPTNVPTGDADTLFGDGGNDTINGGLGADQIFGDEGDDLLGAIPSTAYDEPGDDSLVGGLGNDTINAGDGDDVGLGGPGADTLNGGAGNDTLHGDSDSQGLGPDFALLPTDPSGGAADLINGDEGDDTINGGAGNDTLNGGLGDDVIGIAADFATPSLASASLFASAVIPLDGVYLEPGDDLISGGDGDDDISAGTGNDTVTGGLGDDSILGGEGNDSLSGEEGNDFIDAGDGDDTASGGLGSDTILGGLGNDSLDGDDDDDILDGGLGDDSILGANGNDLITGSDGADSIVGGLGADTIFGDAGNDTIQGNDGDDSIDGGLGEDLIDGGEGNDSIQGNDGNDAITGGAGNDTILGGLGNDAINAGTGDDLVLGGEGDDAIQAGDGNDTVFGEDGADFILGQAGNDLIDGGLGADSIQGNEGDDYIAGQAGDDFITGGLGADTISGGDGRDVIGGGLAPGEAGDPLADGDDLIDGGTDDDAILGDAGNDTIYGSEGDDQLWGSTGDDSILGGAGADSIVGGEGNDFLFGEDGDDVMFGQAGNDTLWGGDDNDLMYGGEGDDTMLGGTPLTANVVHQPRDPGLPSDGNDTMLGGDGFDQVDGGNGDNLMDAGNDGIRETVLGGVGNDIIFSHLALGRRQADTPALDGGYNRDYHRGELVEPPIPAETLGFVTFAIPASAYTGQKSLADGSIIEHPPLSSLRGLRKGRTLAIPNFKATKTPPAQQAAPFRARANLVRALSPRAPRG